MKNQRGLSLIEVCVALGLVGFLGVIIMNVTTEALKSQKRANVKMDIHSDLVIQENVLSNLVNTLDMRMTFTGPGLPSAPNSTYESRFLIPLPHQCRDLGTTDCENDTSLMFVNYKLKTNPAVDVVCNFNATPPLNSAFPNPPSPLPVNAKIFVFNADLTTYGSSTFLEATNTITSTGVADLNHPGDIKLNINSIFAIQDMAQSSLWRVIKGLQRLTHPHTAGQSEMGQACYNKVDMANNDDVYYIYAVPLKPNHLSQDFQTGLSDHTLKLSNTQILTIGRLEPDDNFAINQCLWNNGTNKIECNQGLTFPVIKNVQIARMDHEYQLPLQPETTTKWYDVGQNCTPTDVCDFGDGHLLTVNTVTPGLDQDVSPPLNEMPGVPILLRNEFSYYKLEYLIRIRFRLKQEEKRRDVFIRFF